MFVVTATGTAYVSIASEYGPEEEEEEEEACVYFCASRAGKKEREDRGNTNRQRLHTNRQREDVAERKKRETIPQLFLRKNPSHKNTA